MATGMTKTLEEVGDVGVQGESSLENLVPDSVVAVARNEDTGDVNNPVNTQVVEIGTTVDGDVVSDKMNSEAVVEYVNKADLDEGRHEDSEMGEAGNDDDDDEKPNIDLNWEEDDQENNDDSDSGEEEEEGNEEYQIGDLVWGKIRSHPWWPGQIYDPTDASDYAKKQRSSGHLVAYFGDASFSWCSSSQLLPIKDNFDKRSHQSNSISFVTAVENTLQEVIRLAKLKTTCSCVPMEANQQFVENSGIKEEVLMPSYDLSRLTTFGFEPAELLTAIKSIAGIASAGNRLKVAMITGWLSAFNRAKGNHQLAEYNDPDYIEGLEDNKKKNDKKIVLSPLNIPEEMFSDEELPSSKKKMKVSDLHPRKKKSMADLLKQSRTVETDDHHQTPSTAKRTRTPKRIESNHSRIETKNDKKDDEENIEIVHSPRERKKSKYLSPPYTNPTMFFSKRDFKSDSFDPSSLSTKDESKPESPVKSDSLLMETDESSANEILSALKSAALDQLYIKKKNSIEVLRSFREAFYINGSTYSHYHQNGKKRNLDDSETSNGQKKLKKQCGEKKATLLMVSFPPGFSLPSKDTVIEKFSKFGLLDEKITAVSYNSYCARVAFVNSSDAENAFKTCSEIKEEDPFGGVQVKYRLEFGTGNEGNEGDDGDDKSKLIFIKKKLVMMRSMMENCHGSLSGERKRKLEDEMKGLLEKVCEMMMVKS